MDDYNFFSKGPKTAVEEIMSEYPGAFALRNPYEEKFAVLIKQSGLPNVHTGKIRDWSLGRRSVARMNATVHKAVLALVQDLFKAR